MTKKDLKKWLDSTDKPFEQGLQLFKALARKQVVEKHSKFLSTEEPLVEHQALLMNLLSRIPISPEELEADEESEIVSLEIKHLDVLPDVGDIDLDKVEGFESEKAVIRNLTPEIAALHNKMKDETLSAEARAEIRKDLITLEEDRAKAWDIVKSGIAPGAEKPKTLEELKYLKRAVDDKIRKTKQALEMSTKSEYKEKHQSRLDDQLQEQRELEEAIVKATS